MEVQIKLRRGIDHIVADTPLHGKDLEQLAGREDLIQQLTDSIIRRGEGRFLLAGYTGVGVSSLINKITEETAGLLRRQSSMKKSTEPLIARLDFLQMPSAAETIDRLIVMMCGDIPFKEVQQRFRSIQESLRGQVKRKETRGAEVTAGTGVKSPMSLDIEIGGKMVDTREFEVEYAKYTIEMAINDLAGIFSSLARSGRVSSETSGISSLVQKLTGMTRSTVIVIVLDCVDDLSKVEQLSSLFALYGITFILACDKNLYDKWQELQESDRPHALRAFRGIYVPCLMGVDGARAICDKVTDLDDMVGDQKIKAYTTFLNHLALWGEGIPYLIRREIASYAVRDEGEMCLCFNESDMQKFGFCAGLYRVLNAHRFDILGGLIDAVQTSARDRAYHALYRLVKELVRNGRFHHKDVFEAVPSTTTMRMALDQLGRHRDVIMNSLLKVLVDHGYLQLLSDGAYVLSRQIVEQLQDIPGMFYDPQIGHELLRKIDEETQEALARGISPEEPTQVAPSGAGETIILGPSRERVIPEILFMGRYRMIDLLGVGGMGEVWKAEDTKLGRDVAIKIMLPSLAKDIGLVKRFQREAHLAAKLDHPNIVKIWDIAESDGRPCIIMQYVDGSPLNELIQREPITLAQGINIVSQVLEGLAHAHEKGVIHRDLKPSNILVSRDGRVVIGDFGIAKARESDPLTRGVIGTPGYMSPEQLEGSELDHRSDLYVLGILMYQMFTGQLPIREAKKTKPIAPRSINPNLPVGLERVIMKLMATDPARRYASTQDVSQALKRLVRQWDHSQRESS